MIRALICLSALVCAASAGVVAPALVAPAVSYAAGPALGAPLLGRVTYTAPEVNVVKQPITIDQPEIHYKAVPTLVQPQVVVAQPALHTLVAHQPLVAHPQVALAAQRIFV